MIVLKLQGGLGNQMFEYAFGRNIQEKTGEQLILDISDFEYDKQREYSLDHFVLNNNVVVDSSGKYNRIYDQRTNLFIHIGQKFFPEFTYQLYSKRNIYMGLRKI